MEPGIKFYSDKRKRVLMSPALPLVIAPEKHKSFSV